jgi:hypothetical protein
MAASASMRARRAALFCGRKPAKKKLSVGRPATARAAVSAAGVGDRGHAGVGNQGDRLSADDCADDLFADSFIAVFVVGGKRPVDAEAGKQRTGRAGVLAVDAVGRRDRR